VVRFGTGRLAALFGVLLTAMAFAMVSVVAASVRFLQAERLLLGEDAHVFQVRPVPGATVSIEETTEVVRALLAGSRVTIGVTLDGGFGVAALGVFDTAGEFPWSTADAGGISFDSYTEGRPEVLVVAGSYAADRWERTGQAPHLREGDVVVGVADQSFVPGHEQYVYNLFSRPIWYGRWVVSAEDTELVSHLVATLRRGGFQVDREHVMRPAEFLARSGYVRFLVGMFGASLLVFGLTTVNAVTASASSIRVHRMFGATPWKLAKVHLPAVAVMVFLSAAVGSAGMLLFHRSLVSPDTPVMWAVASWGATSVPLAVIWAVALAVGAGRLDPAERW
jgi:hypothetical protein